MKTGNDSSGKDAIRSDNTACAVTTAGEIGQKEGISPESLMRIWRIIIIGGLFFAMFRQELLRLFISWGNPSESHGILIPAFSLYFIYQERENLARIKGKTSLVGFLVIIAAFTGYLFSIYYQIGYPKPVMMIMTILGIVLFLGGWQILRYTWLPILFLLFAIPLPAGIHEGLTLPMRNLASTVAAFILDLLPGIHCESTYVVIHGSYNGSPFQLNVADACSGMRLLRAFLALGVAMAYLEYRPIWHRIILVLFTIPIAVFCNMLRVLLTGLIYIYIAPRYAQGTPHALLGLLMLLVAFGLYGGVAWILNHLYVEENKPQADVLVIRREKDSPEGQVS